ncbi:lasso peptide isopeptide bond-forming cyclase [Calothrix sp. PCC 6303]|uniref:lasso peptide isopeptide bond-forming cyclase n=1 Tax=Calothrix sp. PCC 6303 TaxID=1170562 RepID=UPI0002A0307F|nr:lasso peptide isopeptide bond-forming cyclase [Calothrix sp. PCC 6303]AFZ00939.1 asparagine synthase [Calothrix sp. PCC 6303]
MSGIIGIYYPNGQIVDPENIQQMVDKLAHRGPDGADIWCSESVGLGHRMLWTTPESLLEKLPMVSEDGNLVITSDCRIDNREELLSRLQLNNCPPEKVTDTDLILAAYQEWGEDCPQHLLGDFAFAIWDAREQKLFCVRDHMGVKPFYYYASDNVFVFGSEIKAILCLPEVPRKLNETKVGDYLASLLQDKVNTFYQGIFRLPPASYLTVSGKGLKIGCYWKLDPNYELQLNSDEEYADKLREIFTEAVRCRLRSAFPIGSHLSGGLDSSSVTCVARQLLVGEKKPLLHTFSNIFNAVPECDERPFIEAVLEQGDIIPHYVDGDRIGPLSDIEQIFQYNDEAVSGPTHFLAWELNEATKQEGVRIILDGFDGDNTISHGHGYFSELMLREEWSTLREEITALHQLSGASFRNILRYYGLPYLEDLVRRWRWIRAIALIHQVSLIFQISRRSLFFQYGIKPLLPESILKAWRKLRGHSQPKRDDSSIVNRRFAQLIGLKKRIQSSITLSGSQLLKTRESHWQGLNAGILTQGLEILDRYAAAFSLEARHPFMDKRLIEFCLSLPPEQKLQQGWSRYVMRRAMENILPQPVQWRYGKSSMSASFVHGLLEHDRQLLEEVMENKLNSMAEYIDVKVLHEDYRELLASNKTQILEGGLDVSIWQVAMLTLWLRHSLKIV